MSVTCYCYNSGFNLCPDLSCSSSSTFLTSLPLNILLVALLFPSPECTYFLLFQMRKRCRF